MLPLIPTNLTAILFSLVTGLGVLFHDTQIEHAALSLVTPPIHGYAASAEPIARSGEDHIHTEKAGENLSRSITGHTGLNTRFSDEKKYLTPKKVFMNTTFDNLT